MVVLNYEIEWTESIFTFVKEWNLEREFEKELGVKLDEWEFDVSDTEAIIKLLNKYRKSENYVVFYDESSNMIAIIRITGNDSTP